VMETLREAGAGHGIADAGYRAIESCRLEKGYLYWSSDISPDTNPIEAGLGFAVAMEKGDFTGREALQRLKATGPARRLVSFAVEGFAPFHGTETVLIGGKPVASLTSAGYGHHLGLTIGFGYLPAGTKALQVEIEAFGKVYPATVGPRCRYDPRMERVRT